MMAQVKKLERYQAVARCAASCIFGRLLITPPTIDWHLVVVVFL